MIEDVLHDIPVEYRDRFQELLAEPPLAPSRLRDEVALYVGTVKQVGIMVKLLDMRLADRLATTAIALVDHVEARGADAVTRRLVQAGVRYFVLEEEDEEITGVLGFDDDAQVLNAVSRAVGRPDLVVAHR